MQTHPPTPATSLSILAATIISAALACAQEPTAPPPVVRPVKILQLGAGGAVEQLEYPGQVSAAQNAEMAFEVSGRIVEFPVQESDRVAEGALLARLDPRDFQNALAAAFAERNRARAFFERVEAAAETGAVSQQEVTDARARFYGAQAEVNIRRKALADSELRAPFDGVMARKLVEDFQNVQAKQPVLIFQDDSHLEVEVAVPEGDLALGGRATDDATATRLFVPKVVVSAFADRVFPARFKEFATTADPVTRTFEATLVFDRPQDAVILPGMTARAVLELRNQARADGLRVPANAVAADEKGRPYVWVIDPDTMQVRRTPVEVGTLSGVDVTVRSGLSGGEMIAISGVHHLREGMEVRRFGG